MSRMCVKPVKVLDPDLKIDYGHKCQVCFWSNHLQETFGWTHLEADLKRLKA